MKHNIILFDDDVREHLLPLTYTRPVAELRIGILTIAEKWEKCLKGTVSYITQEYLSDKFPIDIAQENYVINASALPSEQLCRLIQQLELNEALLHNGELIAAKLTALQFEHLMKNEELEEIKGFELEDTEFEKINHIWDLFRLNKSAIINDFQLLTDGRASQSISSTNTIIGDGNIFLEEGAKVECAILNTNNGPIYIGKNAEIMEGCIIRGGLAVCEGAILKMGSKIYGATTIGPYSKVGGEIKNSLVMGYSNKGHEGFLGNSIVGEWCNLGADTNNSNLKNNYGHIKLWDYAAEDYINSHLQFCGLIMGDHSKCGINTMFNTGTVVGVSANIYGTGFPPKFIPSFSWGGAAGFEPYHLEKAAAVAEKVMLRRKILFTETEKKILNQIYRDTAKFRKKENLKR